MSKYCTRVIKLDDNIAKAKNKALREMLKSDCNYFFLVEENCEVLDEAVYDKFVNVAEETGVEALMWARSDVSRKLPFDDDQYLQYFNDFVSSFSMFTRNVVETVGFLDEKMPPNTWQELEYAKRIGDAGLSSPFGTFAAPRGVDSYFKITKPKDEFKNIKQMEEALLYWEEKDLEDFPVEIGKKKQVMKAQPITEMI